MPTTKSSTTKKFKKAKVAPKTKKVEVQKVFKQVWYMKVLNYFNLSLIKENRKEIKKV